MQELFEVISEGQALHPDPEDLSSEEEGEGAEVLEDIQPLEEGAEFFRTEEDLQFLSAEGTLGYLECTSLLLIFGNKFTKINKFIK